MFSKLALKNVTRSLRDYSVYFLTLTFGVCIFYVFNSMDAQYVMEALKGGNNIARTIIQLIDVISVFVSVVLAFLILYANSFMVRRRKKELGTYLLLGMGTGAISGLLFLETLLIGLLSLGVGLALGVFLSQFISVFTASLFAIDVPEFLPAPWARRCSTSASSSWWSCVSTPCPCPGASCWTCCRRASATRN